MNSINGSLCPNGHGQLFESVDIYGYHSICIFCGHTDNRIDSNLQKSQLSKPDHEQPRSRLDMLICILQVTNNPKSDSELYFESCQANYKKFEKYLKQLILSGYLIKRNSIGTTYQRTDIAVSAIVAYSELVNSGHTLAATALAVLRLSDDGTYKPRLSSTTLKRKKYELTSRGYIEDGKPTEAGKDVLERAKGLFGLVNCALSL